MFYVECKDMYGMSTVITNIYTIVAYAIDMSD